ncbi:hypothetical protein [Roseateles sp. P5_E7]
MWKIVVGFVLFAALALFILTKSGGNIDLGGEKHDVTAAHEPAASEAASAAVTAAVEAASMQASAASQ